MSQDATLVIETSTPLASIARIDGDGSIHTLSFQSDRSHNSAIFPPLQDLLAGHRVALVLVGSGPGSYSGTRVGIAAAQGVAIAMGCPAVAVPSILAVPSADNGNTCLAIGDARRGSYWTAKIANLRLVTSPALCNEEELRTQVATAWSSEISVFSFEDTQRFPIPPGPIALEYPDATRLWHAWQAADEITRSSWLTTAPQPLYLKPPHITPSRAEPK